MGATVLISLVLTILQSVFSAAKLTGVPQDILDLIEGAINNLTQVQSQPVTYSGLESLRVTTKW